MAEAATLQKRTIDESLIAEITEKIVRAFHPRRIILFGSHARGDARASSDIDLFVEMESEDTPLDRYCKVIRLFRGRSWPMDLIVMTPEEVKERRGSLVSIVPAILREGRVLFEADA